jgi:deoxyribodipyrimidine photo-lyase
MKNKPKVNIFWFRRDLRLDDNTGLNHALRSTRPVLPVFIFDTDILDHLESKEDKRVQFIYNEIKSLHKQLEKYGSTLLTIHGKPIDIFRKLAREYDIEKLFANHDYEPDAIKRDDEINSFLLTKNIKFITFKDQVIFEKDEVRKDNEDLYTIYTPYNKKWKINYQNKIPAFFNKIYSQNFYKTSAFNIPSISKLGFSETSVEIPPRDIKLQNIKFYEKYRDYPFLNYTSKLGVHLRFGTISIRKLFSEANMNEKFKNELIWREFYMMILAGHPRVVKESYYPFGDIIKWRNNEEDFEKWKEGRTGYALVDAGMRQLNETGFMHNRARMAAASFLVKHLLIDWRWGETYFASKLLDYEIASNNGNWQWGAGTGCDAAPYFRIFNPVLQQKKYDPKSEYIKTWIEEYETNSYPKPMVEHELAVKRAREEYQKAIKESGNKINKK